jgi:predicted solute-binding protein
MKLTIGFSPCPNDTFIFDAMINGLIDTPGFEWEPVLEDVETLNSAGHSMENWISQRSVMACWQIFFLNMVC